MTIDEAIKHCKDKACDNTTCAIEHKQLAEWLEELKKYRNRELKESEDDKIRKALIKSFEIHDLRALIIPGFSAKDVIAWLEKQGEHAKFINGIQIGDKVTRNEDGVLVNLSQLNRVAKKQCEQKPTDKVEPKFKVGDWILIDKPCQVKSIDNYGNYAIQYSDSDFRERYVLSKNFCESYFHLWTIDDAKDGDVLYSLDSKQPFIFKHRSPNEQAEVYCGINIYGKFFVGNTKDCIITTDKYVPATKEQRDTLMKAMTDAGFYFDFDKKELKKL